MKRLAPHFFATGLLVAALLTGAHEALRNLVTDSRFAVLSRPASGEVVLVAIDSPSLEKVGVWPWPRRLHAELTDKLRLAGATEIAFDVDFSSPSEPDADRRLADALRDAGGSVVLPAFKQWNRDRSSDVFYNYPLPAFAEHSWPALVNVFPDADGLVRRYPFGDHVRGNFVPSLGALLGGSSELRGGAFLIDFGVALQSIPVVSYADVLQQDISTVARFVANKKVIVGATALELGDRVNVPGGRIVSGAMLQALATDSILLGRAQRGSPLLLAAGAGLGLILVMAGSWTRLAHLPRAVLLLSVAGIVEIVALWVQWRWPFVLDTSLLHLVAAAYLAAGALHEIDLRGWLGRIAERRFQRVAMSVGDGLACTDKNGLVTFWNPASAAMFGYTAAEMIGTPLDRVLLQPDPGAPGPSLDRGLLHLAGGNIVELQGLRKNGQAFPMEAHFFGWEGAKGIEYGALLRDISVRKREAERIQYLARVDTLTGLANRHALREHLDAALMEAELEQGELAVLVLDLDKFKDVNDTLGHTRGDDLLRAVAERLQGLVGERGLVARLGGDEFAVIMSDAHVMTPASMLADRICQTFTNQTFALHGRQMQIRCSLGISLYPRDTTSPEQLLSNADLALYRAKAEGEGKWRFYTPEIKAALANKLALEAELARALKRSEFELFYQPQVSLQDRRLIGAEALIRWRHPERGLIGPGEFMQVAHSSASSNEIAYWVLQSACSTAVAWERAGHALRVAVNLSPSQLQSEDLVASVGNVLKTTGLSPRLLDLEVTENILLNDDERAAKIFVRLRALGVGLSFDDFGTGFGGLSYLKKFPFDRLKIDRSFVQEIQNNSDDAAIVSSTIALAKRLGLSVVAEGIEDAPTMDILIDMGCDEGQGFYFGRPMQAIDFERYWWPEKSSATAVAADAA
jgi:diguanylate cyclase (GGDEF)-like protein/PAS domain S-box-containing protein